MNITAFDPFEFEPRWVTWCNEKRGGKVTKVPYCPHSYKKARADNPEDWDSRSAAEVCAKKIVYGNGGGIGIELGDLGNGWSLGGIDLDTCRAADGTVEPWAIEIVERFASYTEVSPSNTGAKIFFKYRTDDLPRLRAAMGGPQHGREFKRGTGKDHPPAIEVHVSNRYFTVTERKLGGVPDRIVAVDTDLILWVLTQAGPAFAAGAKTNGAAGSGGAKAKSGTDNSRSAIAYRKGAAMRRAWKTFDEMVEALRNDPETAEWCREKGEANGQRELHRIWDKAETGGGVSLDDFYAYMPTHTYIYTPTRAMWPASSVNSRIPPIPLLDKADNPLLDEKSKPVKSNANTWLDRNRPVEQMTWAPGLPIVIHNRLILDGGGWIERQGVRVFNLYQPPATEPGDPAQAERWIEHVRYVYPDEADHIINWLAHRVQRPQEKINHALVLGGDFGIGKDTLLEPVKYAVGNWNFQEVSPTQILGRFNGFLKSVILRVSEARDLGDSDRFKFYDHMKAYTAAPPDVLRVDEKNLREHNIINCCGVIITTNYKTDGIYLPFGDRRHLVAWSDLTKDDPRFQNGYWNELWGWYDNGGSAHVAAYLMTLDISGFDPKAPPPKTAVFWAIVDANRSPEEPELADLLDKMANPDAFTLSELQNKADSQSAMDGAFNDWLKDRKNRRIIPHRLEKCGYVPVRNPDDARDGQWIILGKRQTVYARSELPLREQLAAARELQQRR